MLEGRKITTVEGLGTVDDAGPDAARLHRRAGGAVRLLHPGHDDARAGAAAAQPDAERRRDPRRTRAQSVPLRHPHAHPEGGAARRATLMQQRPPRRAGRRGDDRRRSLTRRSVLAGAGALVVSFSSRARSPSRRGAGDGAAEAGAEAARQPRRRAHARRLDPHRRRRARSPSSPARPSSARASRRRSSRSRPRSSRSSPTRIKLVTADTGHDAERGLHRRQPVDAGQRHRDPPRRRAGARDPARRGGARGSAFRPTSCAPTTARCRAGDGRALGYGELVADEHAARRGAAAIAAEATRRLRA